MLRVAWINEGYHCQLAVSVKSVISACFKRESRQVRNWTPDKNIRGDAFKINLIAEF
jgi:hypothetical protein